MQLQLTFLNCVTQYLRILSRSTLDYPLFYIHTYVYFMYFIYILYFLRLFVIVKSTYFTQSGLNIAAKFNWGQCTSLFSAMQFGYIYFLLHLLDIFCGKIRLKSWVLLNEYHYLCLVVTFCDIRLLHHLLILSLDHAPHLFYESLWPPLFTLAHRPLTHHISDHLKPTEPRFY